jgi:hypothetical protein
MKWEVDDHQPTAPEGRAGKFSGHAVCGAPPRERVREIEQLAQPHPARKPSNRSQRPAPFASLLQDA